MMGPICEKVDESETPQNSKSTFSAQTLIWGKIIKGYTRTNLMNGDHISTITRIMGSNNFFFVFFFFVFKSSLIRTKSESGPVNLLLQFSLLNLAVLQALVPEVTNLYHLPLLLQSFGVKCRHLGSIRRCRFCMARSWPSTMSSESVRMYCPWKRVERRASVLIQLNFTLLAIVRI